MKEKILKLKAEGKTYNQIVEIIGCAKSTVSYYCGVDQKEKTAIRSTKKRIQSREWLETYKSILECEICKENRFWTLDFHHTNPSEKEGSVSRLIRTASKERVIKEIEKCKVLCANCHRDLHYKEKMAL